MLATGRGCASRQLGGAARKIERAFNSDAEAYAEAAAGTSLNEADVAERKELEVDEVDMDEVDGVSEPPKVLHLAVTLHAFMFVCKTHTK